MARRTNIVSFEDARTSSRRGSAVGRQAAQSGKHGNRELSNEEITRAFATALSVRDRRAKYGSRASRQESEAAMRAQDAADRTRARAQGAADRARAQGAAGSTRARAQDAADRVSTRTRAQDAADRASTRTSTRTRTRTRTRNQDAAGRTRDRMHDAPIGWDLVSSYGKSETEPAQPKPEGSARDRRRRARTKERAERMFQQQFAAESTGAAAAEDAPRAALYEGKMGAKHRKSARMQRSSQAGFASAKIDPAGWLAYLPFTARSLKVLTAVVCALLVCVFLYTPAQQYYQASRERDKLAAEYSIIEERNHALDAQNDILASDAGLEDAVRQRFGYIKAGEQTAVVTGLSENATDSSRDSENLEPAVLSSSVKAPTEWYTPLLDTFFGVE